MSFLDPNNPNSPIGFIFGAKPGAGVPTYQQLQMRRKIAESLLGQKSRYPKTFGEGLSAIGEAIGERGMMNRIDEMEQAREGQIGPEYNKAMGNPLPTAPATGGPMSYAPEDAGTAPVAAAAVTGDDPWPARSAAIAGIETGGAKDPYSQLGAATRTGDRAHGKYQVMGANIPEWTAAATGAALTPQQFLANPKAQEDVFKHRFGGYVDKYGEEGAAKAWFGGERGMNNPNATDVHRRLTVRDYGQDYLKRLGPRSDVVDPGLNQSVALNPAEPAAPTGPPMAFSGQPTSDTPPVGMPIAGQAPPPPDARAAIAGAITPKPQPVVAPPVPPPPAGPQIAQAPSQQQIRVPEKEPVPPRLQTNPQLNEIAVLSGKLDPNDPRQHGLRLRYQQLQAIDEAANAQKLEEYKYKRKRYDEAPETAAALSHVQAQTRKEAIIDDPQSKYFQTGPGTVSPLQIEGAPNYAPPLPKNEAQLKAMKHYEQMDEAGKIIGEGKALRHGPSAVGSQVPVVGGFLQTDAYRKERAAAERWVINKLRPESGAVLSEKEIDREVRSYFPLPSDDAKTIADKTAARKTANEGMMEASGREGKAFLEWKNKQAAAAETKSKAELGDAVQWLKDNPNDPRAPAVRKKLGL